MDHPFLFQSLMEGLAESSESVLAENKDRRCSSRWSWEEIGADCGKAEGLFIREYPHLAPCCTELLCCTQLPASPLLCVPKRCCRRNPVASCSSTAALSTKDHAKRKEDGQWGFFIIILDLFLFLFFLSDMFESIQS